MATTFFLRNEPPPILGGGPGKKLLDDIRGKSAVSKVTNTTASATFKQVTDNAGGTPLMWYTEMLESVTISGTITFNLRAFESVATVNVGLSVNLQWLSSNGGFNSTILSERALPNANTELSTVDTAVTDTYTPTPTTLRRGDRIGLIVGFHNIGTMAAGTATLSYNASSGGSTGDSFVTFTENVRAYGDVASSAWAGASQGGISGWW